MKIAIFGGGFDPPHLGHINLVKSACANINPDKTLIVPTGNAPHKKTFTPYETRFKLAQAAFIDCPNYEISDIENSGNSSGGISYTVDTLRKLKGEYPSAELFLIVGSDQYESLGQWKSPEEIRRLCTIVPGPRDAFSSSGIRGTMKRKRYTHSINVAIICGELSKKWGLSPLMSQNAYVAGILHDVMKECPDEVLRGIVCGNNLGEERKVDIAETHERKLWHAVAGAVYARDTLGVSEPEVLNAIRFHTVGRAGMSDVEKIVYIADKISPDRRSDTSQELRRLAFEDIDLAVYTAIKAGIKKVLKKDGRVPQYTMDGYNYYNNKAITVKKECT